MREIGLILAAMLTTSTTQAVGLGAIAEKAGPDVAMFLYGIVGIMIICSVGLVCNVIMSLFDENRFVKIINKATFFGAAGTMVIMAIAFIGTIAKAINQVVVLIFG